MSRSITSFSTIVIPNFQIDYIFEQIHAKEFSNQLIGDLIDLAALQYFDINFLFKLPKYS